MNSTVEKRPSAFRTALAMMLNPALVLKKSWDIVPLPFSLSISALAFACFFFQTGLDLMRTGKISLLLTGGLALLGALYGSIGIVLLALLTWVLTRFFGDKHPVKWVISSFGLGYSATLIYALLGLAFSLALSWKTSIAFGVTGVLWAMGPMVSTIKEMTNGRLGVSIVLATICGGLLLFGWSLLGSLQL